MKHPGWKIALEAALWGLFLGVFLAAAMMLSGCFLIDRSVHVKPHYVSPTLPPGCVLKGGVEEPYYPPYVWVQPPGETLWYPGGQCKSDADIGQHGH